MSLPNESWEATVQPDGSVRVVGSAADENGRYSVWAVFEPEDLRIPKLVTMRLTATAYKLQRGFGVGPYAEGLIK